MEYSFCHGISMGNLKNNLRKVDDEPNEHNGNKDGI
jgi:hypothetical protein